METVKTGMGKQKSVCPYDGILSSKEEWWSIDTCYNMDLSQKC